MRKHGLSLIIMATMLAAIPAAGMAAEIHSLSDVALDGSAGENTYYYGSSSGALTLDGSGLATPTIGNGQYGYFASYFTPQTLSNVGDKIIFSFTAQFSSLATVDSALRVGIFDSNGSRVDANGISGSSMFSDDNGYNAVYIVDSHTPTGTDNYIERRNNSSSVLQAGSAFTTVPGSPQLVSLGLSPATDFTIHLTVEKTAGGVMIYSDGNGTVQSIADSTPYTDFDMVSVFIMGGSSGVKMTTSDMSVEVVPEPATMALLAVGAACLLPRRNRKGQ